MAINYPNDPELNDTHTVGNITWTWDGVAWTIVSSSGGGGAVGSGGIGTINADSGTITDETTITIAGGTDIETSIDGTTLTVAYNGAGGGGGGGASSLGELSDVDLDSTPPTSGDVIKYNGTEWVPGPDQTGGASDVNFTDLTDIETAGITVADIYEAATVILRVANNGTAAYQFPSHYGTTDNPTIFVLNGGTVAFDLSTVGGHPFEIQDSTGTPYNTGLIHVADNGTVLTGANAQGQESGTLYWRIPASLASPPNYRYQCTNHIAMVGAITIKSISAI